MCTLIDPPICMKRIRAIYEEEGLVDFYNGELIKKIGGGGVVTVTCIDPCVGFSLKFAG